MGTAQKSPIFCDKFAPTFLSSASAETQRLGCIYANESFTYDRMNLPWFYSPAPSWNPCISWIFSFLLVYVLWIPYAWKMERNPVNSPVEVGSDYPIIYKLLYIQVVRRISGCHQQYDRMTPGGGKKLPQLVRLFFPLSSFVAESNR